MCSWSQHQWVQQWDCGLKNSYGCFILFSRRMHFKFFVFLNVMCKGGQNWASYRGRKIWTGSGRDRRVEGTCMQVAMFTGHVATMAQLIDDLRVQSGVAWVPGQTVPQENLYLKVTSGVSESSSELQSWSLIHINLSAAVALIYGTVPWGGHGTSIFMCPLLLGHRVLRET